MSHPLARRALAALILAGCVLPPTAYAQQQERGAMAQVIQWKVQPDQAMEFESGIAEIVEAAEAAGLEDYRWIFWNDLYTYTLMFPVADMAYFNDPDQWMVGIFGTPGEERLTAALATLAPIQSDVIVNQIVESDASISYQPPNAPAGLTKFAHVDIASVRAGQEEAFNAVIKDFMKLFAEIGYPYPIQAHRVKLGDTSRVDFVTFYDSKAAYHGRNDLVGLAEAASMGEALGALSTRMNATITDWSHFDQEAKPDMTYWPAPDSE